MKDLSISDRLENIKNTFSVLEEKINLKEKKNQILELEKKLIGDWKEEFIEIEKKKII